MERSQKRRGLIALCIAAALGLAAVVMAESNSDSAQAYGGYQSERSQLQAAITQAEAQGYTRDDLQPVPDRLAQLEGQQEPIWVGSRAPFYRDQSSALAALRTTLKDREAAVGTQARSDSEQQLGAAKAALANDVSLDVDQALITPLQARYATISQRLAAATLISDVRGVAVDATRLAADATQLGATQQVENDAIKAAATALEAKDANNLDAVRKEGQEHFTTVKGRETGVLVQSAGDTWRRIRNGPVTFYGGWRGVLVEPAPPHVHDVKVVESAADAYGVIGLGRRC